MLSDAPRMLPRCSQDAPKMLPDASKMLPDAPKMAYYAARMADRIKLPGSARIMLPGLRSQDYATRITQPGLG